MTETTPNRTALAIGTDADGHSWVFCVAEFAFWCPSGPDAEELAYEFPDRETAEKFLSEQPTGSIGRFERHPGPVTNFRVEEI